MIFNARPFVDICARMHPDAKFSIKTYDEKILIQFMDKPGIGSSGMSYILIDANGAKSVQQYDVRDLTMSSKIIKEYEG